MLNPLFALSFEAARFGLEMQSVVALRLMRLMGGSEARHSDRGGRRSRDPFRCRMAASPCGNHLAREGRLARASAPTLDAEPFLAIQRFDFKSNNAGAVVLKHLTLGIDPLRARTHYLTEAKSRGLQRCAKPQELRRLSTMGARGQPTKWDHWHSTARWARIRKHQLLEHPLCRYCLERGIVTPATTAITSSHTTAMSINFGSVRFSRSANSVTTARSGSSSCTVSAPTIASHFP
jgi:hypothetical protein